MEQYRTDFRRLDNVHSGHAGCGCARAIPADPALGPRPFRLPGDPERFGRARAHDVSHLRLEVMLDVEQRAIEARAVITVTARDLDARTLVLDAVGFTVHSVERLAGEGDAGKPVPFRYDGDRLHVTLGALAAGERVRVAVRYHVVPRRGLYFLGPDARRPGRPVQVWSQCQDEDARHWIPCHDFPNVRMSTEFIVDAPTGWTVISNGALLSHRVGKSGRDVWHWSQEAPHVAYLMTLVAGTFSELTADMPKLPVRYYVDPGREADGLRSFGRTPEMITHFEKLTGVKFPWVKYYQVTVHDFTFGGMENTSATTMTDRILLSERAALDVSSDDIVAHELAHQWFGDLVTCRDWSHAWLNEGFATFFEHLDKESKGGDDEYLWSLREHSESYFSEDESDYRRPIVCNTYAYPIDLFDRHLYEKGGWVLHMLRRELGDRVFFNGVKRYLEKHRGGIVETRDLLRAMEDESGRSLESFFDQWVFRAGHPEIEFEASYETDAKLLAVTVRQKQTVDAVTPCFRLALALDVVTAKDTVTHRLVIDEPVQRFTLACSEAPVRVAFDPSGSVLARVTLKLPRDWLLDSLASDGRAIVRWRAAIALAARGEEPAVLDALATAVIRDPFWGVSVEAANALGEVRTERAFERLVKLLDVKHPKVRRAVVRALGDFHTDASATVLLERLAQGDASVMVEGEFARAAGRTKRPAVFDALVAALDRPSWRDVVRIGAIDGLAALRDARALPHVERFVEVGHMLGTRRASVHALGALGEKNRLVREQLEGLLDPNEPYFTPTALGALVQMKATASRGAIERLAEYTLDGRVKRHARLALRDLAAGAESPAELRRMSDSLEKLQQETRSLREDLMRLKALVPGAEPVTKGKRTAQRSTSARTAAKGTTTGRRGAVRKGEDKKR